MPETPVKSSPQVQPKVQPKVVPIVKQPTIKELLTKVSEIKEWYLTFSGKPGHNPHFYILNHIDPVLKLLANSNGIVTAQILTAVNNLIMKEPKI